MHQSSTSVLPQDSFHRMRYFCTRVYLHRTCDFVATMVKTTSFRTVVVCHTNDFKADINEKIKNWVESNGGTFTRELTPDVTHLVASKKAWKRYYPLVKKARRMRTVRIVRFDWLEDSLQRKPIRALPVEQYLFEQTRLKPIKKVKRNASAAVSSGTGQSSKGVTVPKGRQIRLATAEFDQATREFETDMDCAGFHPYSDTTGFVYIVALLRYDTSRKRFEKFGLKLYESNDKPYTYACYIQYTRPSIQKQIRVLAPPGSTWTFAWDTFSRFFLKRTRMLWKDRPSNGTEITIDDQDCDGDDDDIDIYHYVAPAIGNPEGLRALCEVEELDDDGAADEPESAKDSDQHSDTSESEATACSEA